MEYDNFRAMNSEILLAAEGRGASQGFEMARSYIEAAERRFTRFAQTSELAQINQSAGSWKTVSQEMFDLLEIALTCHKASAGLFDPAILPDLEQAGYTKSMDELRIAGAEPYFQIELRAPQIPFANIELRKADLSILVPQGLRIDLGGIAKGWIAEKAAHKLAIFSPNCVVNAGGDMFLIGKPDGMESWEIGLEDPRQPSRDLMTLQVEGGAVATSSVVKRVWLQNSAPRHHLIDPRTGQPALTPWLSVTALAPSAAVAEVFAKAILIGGPDYAGELIVKNPEVTYLAVDGTGQVWIPENGECVHLILDN
ncbi:MAG: FAD:protein FMN transferase [Chloroflexota bacterium]